jgi:hypothetical protein
MAVFAWNGSVSACQGEIRLVMGVQQPAWNRVLLRIPLLLSKKTDE